MKSEITKGALYLFDDAFRERATPLGTYATAMEMVTEMGMALEMAMATEMETAPAMEMEMVTGMETGMEMVTGAPSVCYLEKYKPFENGLAVLGEITKHPKYRKSDICQLLFNNKNGIRYLYLDQLEKAEKVSK